MAKKIEHEVEENVSTEDFFKEGKEVPAWIAAVGTYSVLTAYNRFVAWLSSFLDVPPWGIVSRDIFLSATNVLLGEFVARRVMKGPPGDTSVDTAIRAGYIASSVQTLSTGIYEAWMKRKSSHENGTKALPAATSVEEAKKIYLSAKEEFDQSAKRLQEAEAKYAELSGKTPQTEEEPTKNVGEYKSTSRRLNHRSSKRAKKAALSGLSC
jgi:hypothetical protein